jgi:hypothetical protein
VPIPTAETPPEGLNAYWLGTWRHALKTLKAQGSWAWEQKPLLDEYVFALKAAEDARRGFDWLDSLEKYVDANADDMPTISWTVLGQIAGGLPVMWDRHSKRASALAEQLLLTPISRKKAGVKADGEAKRDEDPFAGLDEISQAREARANGA